MSVRAPIAGLAARRLRAVAVVLISGAAGLGAGVPAVQAAVGGGARLAASTSAVTSPPTGPIGSGYLGTRCVDDRNDSSADGTWIVAAPCNDSAEQNWTVETDGTIQIHGKCLDVYRERKGNNTPIDLWPCTGRGNQQWTPVNGTLVNPISGKCLDDPGRGRQPIWWLSRSGQANFVTLKSSQLVIYTCNGGRNQQWSLP